MEPAAHPDASALCLVWSRQQPGQVARRASCREEGGDGTVCLVPCKIPCMHLSVQTLRRLSVSENLTTQTRGGGKAAVMCWEQTALV